MKENKKILRVKACVNCDEVLVSYVNISYVDVYESETIPDGISKS